MRHLERTTQPARMRSLDGAAVDVKVLTAAGCNNITVEHKGNKYTAVFNGFVGCLYVDDVDGLIEG